MFRPFFIASVSLICLVLGCSDDESGAAGAQAVDAGLRDGRVFDAAGGDDTATSDAGSAGDSAADAPGVDADGMTDTGAGEDSSGEDTGAPGPGPDDLAVDCQGHEECPADGDDPGICCTTALRYISECGTESVCTGGQRDACLRDNQCQVRRPGEWTVCCHDRGDRNYCAPVRETCEPLQECESPDDCTAFVTQPCCVYHEYYQRPYCTSGFFAGNPGLECP